MRELNGDYQGLGTVVGKVRTFVAKEYSMIIRRNKLKKIVS